MHGADKSRIVGNLANCYIDSPETGFTHYSWWIDMTVNLLHQNQGKAVNSMDLTRSQVGSDGHDSR
jgi:hypothetical protein